LDPLGVVKELAMAAHSYYANADKINNPDFVKPPKGGVL